MSLPTTESAINGIFIDWLAQLRNSTCWLKSNSELRSYTISLSIPAVKESIAAQLSV